MDKIFVHNESRYYFTTYIAIYRYLIKRALYTSRGFSEKERPVRGLKIISQELKNNGGFHVLDINLNGHGAITTTDSWVTAQACTPIA